MSNLIETVPLQAPGEDCVFKHPEGYRKVHDSSATGLWGPSVQYKTLVVYLIFISVPFKNGDVAKLEIQQNPQEIRINFRHDMNSGFLLVLLNLFTRRGTPPKRRCVFKPVFCFSVMMPWFRWSDGFGETWPVDLCQSTEGLGESDWRMVVAWISQTCEVGAQHGKVFAIHLPEKQTARLQDTWRAIVFKCALSGVKNN